MKRPNILMIMVDQFRYDCMGYSKMYPVKTPNIDKLAASGVFFSNAYTPIPICCPARQALVTGRRPESFGALWNYGISFDVMSLAPTEFSWASQMQRKGYKNSFVGHWHVNPKHSPLEYGYDDFTSFTDYNGFIDEKYPNLVYENGLFGEENPVDLADSRTHWLTSKAINKIHEYNLKDEPWHIRLNIEEPHPPCRPSKPFSEMYTSDDVVKWGGFDDDFENKPYIQKQQLLSWDIENYTWDDWSQIVARYYCVISQIDDAIGNIINTIKDLGIAQDTMIIFTSDHGDMCGSHKMMDKHNVLYDDIVRVPFIISWPGHIQQEQINNNFVYNCLDLAPTIVDLLDIKISAKFHGKSLLPLIMNQDDSNWRKEIVCTYNGQQFGLLTQRMIRNNDYKYIWNTGDIDELYDMKNDPYEMKNLIYVDVYKEIISNMRKKLYEILNNEDDRLVQNQWTQNQLLNDKIV